MKNYFFVNLPLTADQLITKFPRQQLESRADCFPQKITTFGIIK